MSEKPVALQMFLICNSQSSLNTMDPASCNSATPDILTIIGLRKRDRISNTKPWNKKNKMLKWWLAKTKTNKTDAQERKNQKKYVSEAEENKQKREE